MIKVSVILCCFNGETFVRNALESAFAQTLGRDLYELVFVDDGSEDDTASVVAEFASRGNLRYIENVRNLGLVRSCNIGLRASCGEYVIRLDADDTFAPSILEEMYVPLDRGETDFVYSDRHEIVGNDRLVRYVNVGCFDVFRLIACGTMMRRSLVLDVGGYRDLFWEEYDLYLRYLKRSGKSPYYLPRALYSYVIRSGAMTSDPVKVRKGWTEFQQVWSKAAVAPYGTQPAWQDL